MKEADQKFWTSTHAAMVWGMSNGRARSLCRQGRVPGAYVLSMVTPNGKAEVWMIPEGTPRPGSIKEPQKASKPILGTKGAEAEVQYQASKMNHKVTEPPPIDCRTCPTYKAIGHACRNTVKITWLSEPGKVCYRCPNNGRRIITSQEVG